MSEQYDLVVIGGGSGGMACAKQAAALGARVVLFDFVKPSTQGTVWGLGGTCVNVGCIPKKLCHYSALLGQSLHDARELGWQIPDESVVTHDWSKLVETVTNHVKMLNFRYRGGLTKSKVTYINAFARFIDPHTVAYIPKGSIVADAGSMEKTITATHIVIAVGGRPHIPTTVPGALQYAISSDDIFSLKKHPGKTLCVGGGYISMECAGFLTELGYDVTVAARSVLLRDFDRQCAAKIGSLMVDLGTKIYQYTNIKLIEKLPSGRLRVFFQHSNYEDDDFQHSNVTSDMSVDEFDTVLYATGRRPDLSSLNLSAAGVEISTKTGKIPTVNEVTNIPHIYAVGDVCEEKQELTPVAIHAGKLLAKRLFSSSTLQMSYDLVATAIFTPFEYGSVGLSEEDAIQKYGVDDLEIYLFEFSTLELTAVHRVKKKAHTTFVSASTHGGTGTGSNNNTNNNSLGTSNSSNNISRTQSTGNVSESNVSLNTMLRSSDNGNNEGEDEGEEEDFGQNCLSKLLCLKSEGEKVIGFHFIGPNAGEITQGFALSLKLGATKEDFDQLVGIHPTDAESFCALEVTRRSGQVYTAEGGCGGGVCG